MKIIGGTSNKMLVSDICDDLLLNDRYNYSGIFTDVYIDKFSDGETRVEILDNVRGKDIFVIQSLSNPTNHYIMELCFILDALKRSNVKSVTVILPIFSYARQDRKVKSRVPISAKTVADIIQTCGLNRLMTVDLHSGQIQGFFNIPVDNLYAAPLFISNIKSEMENETVVVSPDAGGIERATYYAKRLGCGLAYCYKHREKPNEIGNMRLIGCVEGKDCILVDDMVDTAGTLCKSAEVLKENGAKKISAYATHGVLSSNAVEKITISPIEEIFITDTIQLSKKVLTNPNFNVISVSGLIANAIDCIAKDKQISKLFD